MSVRHYLRIWVTNIRSSFLTPDDIQIIIKVDQCQGILIFQREIEQKYKNVKVM